jgi:AcrR family transcriptional regulator
MLGWRTVSEVRTQSRARKPRRDQRRERNRQNLIDSALHLVAAEGAGLSVARVTRKAGMDPAGFYAHFKNIGECERAVAEEFRSYVESHIRAYEGLRAARSLEAATDAIAALLASWLTRREWVILLARCRFDDTTVGSAVREMYSTVRRDLQEALWNRAVKLGLPAQYRRETDALADACIGLFVASLERLAEGRETDVRGEAERLMRADRAVIADAFQRILAARQERTGQAPAADGHAADDSWPLSSE